jgi:signal transduction histidine kinase
MLRLVNELLDVATIEAGELQIQLAACRLDEVVTKCAYLANMDAGRKKTSITVEPLPKLPEIQADEAKIKQVVENLLSNAIKYSPPASTIRVALRASTNEVLLSVFDQGPGIPEHERDRLFKDFGRLSTKPTGGEKSTGLGLAICHKIVEAHRGSINAYNLPDRGCEFRVTLPLA